MLLAPVDDGPARITVDDDEGCALRAECGVGCLRGSAGDPDKAGGWRAPLRADGCNGG